METKDLITIIIAVWGAGLSTYLGIRELLKERRRIKLILEHVTFREIVQLIIVNIGRRPVTITEITAAIPQEGPDGVGHLEGVPNSALFGVTPELPKLLKDGETVIYELGAMLSEIIIERFNKGGNVYITVYDAERNVYTKYERRRGDFKLGGSVKVSK